MDRIGIEDAKELLVDSAKSTNGFLEFEKTCQEIKSGFLTDRELHYLIYYLAQDIAVNRQIKRSAKVSDQKKSDECFNAAVEIAANTRIKEMAKDGKLMTIKTREKYKAIIKELTRGSIYDFASAMRLQFPNYGKSDKGQIA